jgi:hypothetical protein
MQEFSSNSEDQQAQNYAEIIESQKTLFVHLANYCPHNSNSNFLHISDSQWKSLREKMGFFFQCEQGQIEFLDNARPFSCSYEEVVRNRPEAYSGFEVKGKKEGFGILTYWNGVVKYKGEFQDDEPSYPDEFKAWNSK